MAGKVVIIYNFIIFGEIIVHLLNKKVSALAHTHTQWNAPPPKINYAAVATLSEHILELRSFINIYTQGNEWYTQ